MARPRKQTRPLITFKHPVKVEVYRPEFKLFASVAHLDVAKLARTARTEIELGYIKNDCCRQVVRAIIRKGMVTDLQAEPCSEAESEPPSAEFVRLLNIARRRALRHRRRTERLPVPVAEFIRKAIDLEISQIPCYLICIFGFCFVCCYDGEKWVCGKGGVIIKVPPTRRA